MKRLTTIFSAIATLAFCSAVVRSAEARSDLATTVSIATFNIWRGGMGGGQPLPQTVAVIKACGADIVGVQESGISAMAIARSLGWNCVQQNRSCAVLSRFEITGTTESKQGIRMRLDNGKEMLVFNVHLPPAPYQPYQLLNIPYKDGVFITTEEQAIKAAQEARGDQVQALLREIASIESESIPIFVTGDFNEPSHLDWTGAAADAGRHPIRVTYPASSAMAKAGFADAYRTIHPSELTMPGYTWTPVTKATDPKDHHDRIDFVYFRGEAVRLISARIVGENEENADIVVGPYPSDHRLVVATLAIGEPEGN